VTWLKVETVHLFPEVRASLTGLLRELTNEQWAAPTVCTGWSVGDLAAHLLGVELGNVSIGRDLKAPETHGDDDVQGEWLSRFNQRWVDATRRLSPEVVADLLDISGAWYEDYILTLDLEAFGDPVEWAGPRPAPVWMNLAREYTERWVHQQQIREAVGRPGLLDARYTAPVIAAFVHAVPVALAGIASPEGSAVNVQLVGEGGGVWHVVRYHHEWDLWPGPHANAAAQVTTSVANAWRLFTRHPRSVPPQVTGDPSFGSAVSRAVGIIA
jgi:uncharacterized protein (TIGR03083 family)